MTYEEVVAAARRLPVPEQLRMIEEVSRSVRETLAAPAPTDDDEAQWRAAFEAERAVLLRDVPADSSLHQLLGIARTRRGVPMTKEEMRTIITEHLMEKYG